MAINPFLDRYSIVFRRHGWFRHRDKRRRELLTLRRDQASPFRPQHKIHREARTRSTRASIRILHPGQKQGKQYGEDLSMHTSCMVLRSVSDQTLAGAHVIVAGT